MLGVRLTGRPTEGNDAVVKNEDLRKAVARRERLGAGNGSDAARPGRACRTGDTSPVH